MKTQGSIAMIAVSFVVLGGFGAATVIAQAGAQQAPPARVLVTTTQVKPGMGADYRTIIQNETVPANKKAGVPWRWVFQGGPLSGSAGTFVTVAPVTNFAQFDGPNPMQRALGNDGAAKVNAKIQATIAGTHNVLQTLLPGASLQSFPSTPPALIRVQTVELIAGKGGEFATLITQGYLPALKKAGVTDYLVFTTNYGGPGNQRSIVEFLSKYADLDQPNPMARALGQEGAQKLNLQRTLLTNRAENAIYRLVPELSYGVPTRPKT